MNTEGTIASSEVFVYTVPTEGPESDGTLEWHETTMVVVTLGASGYMGWGYAYASAATAMTIQNILLPLIRGKNVLQNTALCTQMLQATRNLGHPGITAMAVAAVDNALWDLKAKLLELPLCKLWGQQRDTVPVYASGGFTSYDPKMMVERFSQKMEDGHKRFKMKIGRDWQADLKRLDAARKAIGHAELFVDANGAYHPKDSCAKATILKDFGVSWFEEPVSSDDLHGLQWVRDHCPPEIQVAAGEYGYTLSYFKNILETGSVDVLQADATRCGLTTFLKVYALCEAFHLPMSAHCAPALHLHPALCMPKLLHVEYFHDHVRMEGMFFEGFPKACNGAMEPNLGKTGMGLEFKFKDAEKYRQKI